MRSSLKKRTKDFIWYVLISTTFIAIIVAAALSGMNQNIFTKSLYFAVQTFFVFWYFIASSRTLWKRRSFWILTGFFCWCTVAHLPLF